MSHLSLLALHGSQFMAFLERFGGGLRWLSAPLWSDALCFMSELDAVGSIGNDDGEDGRREGYKRRGNAHGRVSI